jgi:hypothetical protein
VMVVWIAILILLTINILFITIATRDLVNRAYFKGYRDGVEKMIEKDYVRLDAIIKND